MVIEQAILSPNNLSTVSFAIGFPRGAATEDQRGISNVLTSHLLRNTASMGENDLAIHLDKHGINTFESVNKTHLFVGMNAPPQHLDVALDTMQEILFNPEFNQDSIQKIVQQQMGNLQQIKQIPQIRMFQSTRWEAAFGTSRVARSPLGSEEDLPAITSDDLDSYYREVTQFTPKFAAVGIDINEAKFTDLVDQLGSIGGKKASYDLWSDKVAPLNKQVDEMAAKSKNTYMGINFLSKGYDESELEDVIFQNVMSGGFSARMFMEIRDNRNLSYSVFCLNSKFDDFGLITAGMDVRPDRAVEALEVTLELMDDVLTEDIKEDEIRRALKSAQKTTLFVSDSSESYTSWLISRLMNNREYDLDKEKIRLEAAAEGDWQESMLQHFKKENFTLGIAGEPGEAAEQWEETIEEKVN